MAIAVRVRTALLSRTSNFHSALRAERRLAFKQTRSEGCPSENRCLLHDLLNCYHQDTTLEMAASGFTGANHSSRCRGKQRLVTAGKSDRGVAPCSRHDAQAAEASRRGRIGSARASQGSALRRRGRLSRHLTTSRNGSEMRDRLFWDLDQSAGLECPAERGHGHAEAPYRRSSANSAFPRR